MSLGIRRVRSSPGCPQDNGGHERTHADMSGELQSHPAATVETEQRRLSRWRHNFNHVRPHDAWMGKVPADIDKLTERRRRLVALYVHLAHMYIRTVSADGAVFFRDERYVGESFRGVEVGLEPVDALLVRAWYRDVDLGPLETLPNVDVSCFDPRPDRDPLSLCLVKTKFYANE